MLQSAAEHHRAQQHIVATALIAAHKAARRGSAVVAAVVTAYQLAAAREATQAVPQMLAEQGVKAPPAGMVALASLAGIASDGRPLDTLFAQASNAYALGLMVSTQVRDAARVAAGVETAIRPALEGYVRVLNPPSCSRCAVLAGKIATWDVGYERHPGCDCYSIPIKSMEAARSEGLLMHPKDYFDTLPTAAELDAKYPHMTVQQRRHAGIYSQEDIFTKAGAEAIRDGADPGQVVNARRGMKPAQLYGHDVLLTTEGTTKSGLAFKALQRGRGGTETLRQAEELATRLTRKGPELRRIHRTRARSPRLMPETIYQLANGDRKEAIRLLKAHGFVL